MRRRVGHATWLWQGTRRPPGETPGASLLQGAPTPTRQERLLWRVETRLMPHRIPALLIRGGTSKGLFFHAESLMRFPNRGEEVIRKAMVRAFDSFPVKSFNKSFTSHLSDPYLASKLTFALQRESQIQLECSSMAWAAESVARAKLPLCSAHQRRDLILTIDSVKLIPRRVKLIGLELAETWQLQFSSLPLIKN